MDYDLNDIPAGYDRGRDHGPEVLDLWMRAVESRVNGERVTRLLDLGCGTGRFSAALADRLSADIIGIDPSMKMLAQARMKARPRRVHYARGQAEAIPLRSGCADAIFMSMSFHHFDDPGQAVRECGRVLGDGGQVFVRTGTREQIEAYAYVPFFPTSRGILAEVLPDQAELREPFEAAGFATVESTVVEQTIATDWAAYAEKLAAGGDSVLARLSQADLDRGMAALRAHAIESESQAVVEPIDLLVFR